MTSTSFLVWYFWVAPSLVLTAGALAFLAMARAPRWTAPLAAFVLPFGNVAWHSGVSLDMLDAVVIGAVLGLAAPGSLGRAQLRDLHVPRWLLTFLGVVCVSTALGFLFIPDGSYPPGYSWFRTVGRPLTQAISLALRVALFLLLVLVVRRSDDVRRVLLALLAAGGVLLVGGLWEYYIFEYGGPWMGIVRPDFAASGGFGGIGGGVIRSGSFAGEPKMLGQALAPLLVLGATATLLGRRILPAWALAPLLAGWGILFFTTYSGAAWLGLALAFPLVVALLATNGAKGARSAALLVGILLAFFAAGAAVLGPAELSYVWETRVGERIEPYLHAIGDERPPDATGLGAEVGSVLYMRQNPWVLALGTGNGLGHYHVAPYVGEPYGSLVQVNSGPVRELLEWGLGGFALFWGGIGAALAEALRARRSAWSPDAAADITVAASLVAVAATLDLGFSTEQTGLLWLLLGLLVATVRLHAPAAFPAILPAAAPRPAAAGAPVRKVAVLWTEIPGYLVGSLRALRATYDVDVRLARAATRERHEFDDAQLAGFPDVLTLPHGSSRAREAALRAWLARDLPEVVLVAGWNVPEYRRIAPWLRRRGVVVVSSMDNQWKGTLRQRLGGALLADGLAERYDALWVTGDRAASFGRRLGFDGDRLWRGFYVGDDALFGPVGERRLEAYAAGKPAPRRFLFVGRYVPEKGVHLLAEAYRRYRASVPDPWELACAGSGPLERVLRDREGVRLLGFLQPNDLAETMADAGAFVLPSVDEPWGVVVHEATLAGLPILASRAVGAAVELVADGANGVTFGTEDPDELAAAMRRISHGGLDLARLGVASRTLAARYTRDGWAETFGAIVRARVGRGLAWRTRS